MELSCKRIKQREGPKNLAISFFHSPMFWSLCHAQSSSHSFTFNRRLRWRYSELIPVGNLLFCTRGFFYLLLQFSFVTNAHRNPVLPRSWYDCHHTNIALNYQYCPEPKKRGITALCVYVRIWILVLLGQSRHRLFTKTTSPKYLKLRAPWLSPVPAKSDNVLSAEPVASGVIVIDGTVPASIASTGVPAVPKNSRQQP